MRPTYVGSPFHSAFSDVSNLDEQDLLLGSVIALDVPGWRSSYAFWSRRNSRNCPFGRRPILGLLLSDLSLKKNPPQKRGGQV
jgi:hypothetical protein